MATRKPIGQLLLDKGLVEKEQIQRALEYQQRSGENLRLGEILVKFGYVTEEDVLVCVGEQFDVPVVKIDEVRPDVEAVDAVPRSTAKMNNILPLKKTGNSITVAMSDLDLCAIDNLKFILNMDVKPMLAPEQDIADAIERYYGGEESTVDNMLREFTEGELAKEEEGAEGTNDIDSDAPIVRLVSLIVSDAVEGRASDIHVEPMPNRLRIRYRIDGVCQEMESPPKRLQNPILARLKLMAGMDLAEKRKCQDGRIPMRVNGRYLDLRVSDIPTTDGESIVMRILDKQSARVSLTELGFHPSDLSHFERIIRRPNGIFLVTGPTGSGKTTTLYSALNALNRSDTKIITAEDPIEYTFSGINQSQVQTEVERTFPVILRAMLRQAPEIILVGEIRDARDGRDRRARRPHRPPRLQHPAHQRCPQRHPAPYRHGHQALHGGLLRAGHHGPAPGAHHLPQLQRTLRGGPQGAALGRPGAGGGGGHHLPPRRRLQPLQPHRLLRPAGHLRADGDEQRPAQPDLRQGAHRRDPREGPLLRHAHPAGGRHPQSHTGHHHGRRGAQRCRGRAEP